MPTQYVVLAILGVAGVVGLTLFVADLWRLKRDADRRVDAIIAGAEERAALTPAERWGGPEMVPTYLPGDPEQPWTWQMEHTPENMIRNPLVALAWPPEVRRALVREVIALRAASSHCDKRR